MNTDEDTVLFDAREIPLGKLVLDSIEDAVSIIRISDFTVLWANRAFEKLHGEYRSAEGNYTCHQVTHHLKEPCDGPQHECPVRAMMQTGRMSQCDHLHYDDHGHAVYAEIITYPIDEEDGTVTRAIHIARDITIRKELENRLMKKTEDLLSLNLELKQRVEKETNQRLAQEEMLLHQARLASMGEMLSAIAHQWKQPLNELSLIASEMEDRISEEEIPRKNEDLPRSIHSVIGFMDGAIEDFRGFLRNNSTNGSFDLFHSLRDVLSLLSRQLTVSGTTVQIRINLGGSASLALNDFLSMYSDYSCSLRGNANEFRHVMLNIINNAREIMQQEKIPKPTIDIEVFRQEDTLFIHIIDSGPGIVEAHLEKVFQRSFSTRKENWGLGLYLSKMIIEQKMAGKIQVANNQIGSGARFTISLPYSAQE